MQKFFGLLVVLITTAVPVWVTWHIFELGGSPAKEVFLDKIGPMDPIYDLKNWPENIKLKMSINGQVYSQLNTFSVSLENESKVPIKPEDFYKPLCVTVNEPWELVAISPSVISQKINLEWKRIDKRTLSATPFLMNPDDRIHFTVYVGSPNKIDGKAKIEVKARIVSLKSFKTPKSIFRVMPKVPFVYLSVFDVVVLLFFASIFFTWYYSNLVHMGLIRGNNPKSIIFALCAALLSFSVAEVIVYYVLGSDPVRESILGRRLFDWKSQWQNWSILIIHISCSLYLYKNKGNPIS